MWHPGSWSRFDEFIRTNNDAEGLHHCWNMRAGSNVPFYKLTTFLTTITGRVSAHAKLLAHGLLKREQRAEDKEKNEMLSRMWTNYKEKNIS